MNFSFRNLFPFLFADDIFLSYSRKDGNAYTASLARELTAKKYKVFFDHYGTPPGSELPKEVISKALSAKMFILIATDEALESRHVRREVELFVEKRHKQNKGVFQCINFGAFAETDWVNNSKLNTISYISETDQSAENNKPSQTVIDFINDSFIYNKSNYKLRRAAAVLGTVLLTMGIISIYFTRQAFASRADLKKQETELNLVNKKLEQSASLISSGQEELQRISREKIAIDSQLSEAKLNLTKKEKEVEIADTKRIKAEVKLKGAEINLYTAQDSLAASQKNLEQTNITLARQQKNLKEITKQAALEGAKGDIYNSRFSSAYKKAVTALKNNRRIPGSNFSDYCDSNVITKADLGLLFTAAVTGNFRESSLINSGYEYLQSLAPAGNYWFASDNFEGPVLFHKTKDGWEEQYQEDGDETDGQLLKYFPVQSGLIYLSGEYDDTGSNNAAINYYSFLKGRTKLLYQDTFGLPEKNLYTEFTCTADKEEKTAVVYAIKKGTDEEKPGIYLRVYSLADKTMKLLNKMEIEFAAGTILNDSIYVNSQYLNIGLIKEEGSYFVRTIHFSDMSVKEYPAFTGYKVVQNFTWNKTPAALLQINNRYRISFYNAAGQAENFDLPLEKEIKAVMVKEVTIENAATDTILVGFTASDSIANREKTYKLLLAFDKNKQGYFIRIKAKEIKEERNFVYDPSAKLFYFSRRDSLFFQPVFSDLEFMLGRAKGDIGSIETGGGLIYTVTACPSRPQLSCSDLASWNKPVIAPIADTLYAKPFDANADASQLNSLHGFVFDNNLNFFLGRDLPEVEKPECNNSVLHAIFFNPRGNEDANRPNFFETEEEFENYAESEQTLTDNDGPAIAYSPDQRWIFTYFNNQLEVVDLVHRKNLDLNFVLPGLNIDKINGCYFSGNGKYLFLLYENFIYRLNMPNLVSEQIKK